MSITLKERLLAKKMTSFTFTSFERKVSADDDGGSMSYLIFTLDKPIESVTGTNPEYDRTTDVRHYPKIVDVLEVQCKLEVLGDREEEFTFEEDSKNEFTGAGSYSGDLLLDVAKSSLKVWITDVPFSKLSSDWKKAKHSERLGRLLDAGKKS